MEHDSPTKEVEDAKGGLRIKKQSQKRKTCQKGMDMDATAEPSIIGHGWMEGLVGGVSFFSSTVYYGERNTNSNIFK